MGEAGDQSDLHDRVPEHLYAGLLQRGGKKRRAWLYRDPVSRRCGALLRYARRLACAG